MVKTITQANRDVRRWVETNHPEMLVRMRDAPSYMMQARPEAVRQMLDELVDEHGSVRNYLSAIGVGTAQLDVLADTLTA